MNKRMRAAVLAGLVAATALMAGFATSVEPPAGEKAAGRVTLPRMEDLKPRDYPGVHNAVAFYKNFVSGSVPEGKEGFETLKAMGVKTIISVDGAEPDVARAKALGMRYIHLPIGYNGFDAQRKLQLTRATRDAMADGPVYIHCHHGKHRSAGAAAAIAASLGWETPEQGVARMQVSGTAANYVGLYACAKAATVVDKVVLDAISPDFPEVWKPTGYVKGMVEVDDVFENLKEIEKAGWAAPKDHPDLVPVAEAGRLADLYRVLHDTDYVKGKPAEFGTLMTRSQGEAQSLEDMLVDGKPDVAKLSAQFKLVAASCKECHASYRDKPE